MPTIQCNDKIECFPCDDQALRGFELGEREFWVRNWHVPTEPGLNRKWEAVGCSGVCESDVSQADADLCAQLQSLYCGEDCELPNTCVDPVCVAKFGNDHIGLSTETLSADSKRFVKFTVPNDFTVLRSLHFYLSRTLDGFPFPVTVGIYTDNSGSPDTLVEKSKMALTANVTRDIPQWYEAGYSDPPMLTPGQDYWFGILSQQQIVSYYDAGSSNQQADAPDTFTGGLSDPFGTPTFSDNNLSCYVCYGTGVFNDDQTATDDCPDGSMFTYTVPHGTVPGINKDEANVKALSIAQEQVRLRTICLSDIIDRCCIGQLYGTQITATGVSVAYPAVNLWQIVSGVLPPGTVFVGGSISGPAAIQGTPTVVGLYLFTVRVTAQNGFFAEKSYSIEVTGITTTSPLPDAKPGTFYSVSLSQSGFSSPTWSISTGSLPTGFTLNSVTGVISGTTSDIGDFNFTVTISDATHSCSKAFHLACFIAAAKRINAWKQWSGYQDLRNTYNFNSENTPPPVASYCNQRWLTKTVYSQWNGLLFSEDDPCNARAACPPNPTGPSDSNDAYVYHIDRYNPSLGEILVSCVHTGTCIGDAYNQAHFGGYVQSIELWDVQILNENEYQVHIKFTSTAGGHFDGTQHVVLSDPYSLDDLQNDLVQLWNSVDPNDYDWQIISGTQFNETTIDVTYAQWPGTYPGPRDYKHPIHWCLTQNIDPDDIKSHVNPVASAYCAAVAGNYPVDPSGQFILKEPAYPEPLRMGPLEANDSARPIYYHGGYLFNQHTGDAGNPFWCVNLVKTYMRYAGLYCQRDFAKAVPIDEPINHDAYDAMAVTPHSVCNPPWQTGVITPKNSPSLQQFTVYPLPGVAPYTPGIRTLLRNCGLLEWWAMEQSGLNDRIGSILSIPMVPNQSAGGTITNEPGIISQGASLSSPGFPENEFMLGSLNTSLAYPGDSFTDGITITGWFKYSASSNISDVLVADWAFNDVTPQHLLLFVQNGTASATLITAGPTTTSSTITLDGGIGPIVGTWYFFRVFYDNVNGQIGIQINNGAIAYMPCPAMVAASQGSFSIAMNANTPASVFTVVTDEVGVWGSLISDELSEFLFNSGNGRTFPF